MSRDLIEQGLACLGGRSMPSSGVVVLCYHRISPNREHCRGEERMRVSAASFEEQLEFLARTCVPLHLSEAVRALGRRRPMRGLHACVTFDDGYADVLDHGLPILEKYGIPFTFFITTDFVDGCAVPWWERQAHEREPLGSHEERTSQALPGARATPGRPGPDGLSARGGPRVQPGKGLFCTWRSLARHLGHGLMELGCHTVSHSMLSRCTDGGKREIIRSRETIRERLGVEASLFAYPFGMTRHIGKRTPSILKAHGFAAAATIQAGINRQGVDLYRMRRLIMTGHDTEETLEHKIRTADVRGRIQGLLWRLRSPECIFDVVPNPGRPPGTAQGRNS